MDLDFDKLMQTSGAVSCEKCKSAKVAILASLNIKGVAAYACFGCNNFQVFAKDKDELQKILAGMK